MIRKGALELGEAAAHLGHHGVAGDEADVAVGGVDRPGAGVIGEVVWQRGGLEAELRGQLGEREPRGDHAADDQSG